jgi:hypothetical protein
MLLNWNRAGLRSLVKSIRVVSSYTILTQSILSVNDLAVFEENICNAYSELFRGVARCRVGVKLFGYAQSDRV